MSFAPPPPEPEALPKRLSLLLALTLCVLAGAVGLARLWQRYATPRYTASPPAQAGNAEVGGVLQRPFALERTAADARAEQLDRLGHYGWVDRKRSVIHLPIDRAFEQVLSEERR